MKEKEFRAILSDIFLYSRGLKESEYNFILVLDKYDFKNVTPKQIKTLREIFNKRV